MTPHTSSHRHHTCPMTYTTPSYTMLTFGFTQDTEVVHPELTLLPVLLHCLTSYFAPIKIIMTTRGFWLTINEDRR